MTPGELVGYLAAALVLATFAMRTMIPLRILGIASNIAFIAYGIVAEITPVLLLHAILLPLNVYRLFQIRAMIRAMQAAGPEEKPVWLIPYMTTVRPSAGTMLFRRGDAATDLYYIVAGKVRLVEFHADLGPGQMVGEIGVFSPEGIRTASVECATDCELLRISRDRVRELALQNPPFAFHLIGLVAGRLIADMREIESRAAHRHGERADASADRPG